MVMLGVPLSLVGSDGDWDTWMGFEGQAMNLIMGIAANRLQQRIGRGQILDMVDVDLGTGGISRIQAGKFFSPKLFVSVGKEVSSPGFDLALEYEVLPQLKLEFKHENQGDRGGQLNQDRESVGFFWGKEW